MYSMCFVSSRLQEPECSVRPGLLSHSHLALLRNLINEPRLSVKSDLHILDARFNTWQLSLLHAAHAVDSQKGVQLEMVLSVIEFFPCFFSHSCTVSCRLIKDPLLPQPQNTLNLKYDLCHSSVVLYVFVTVRDLLNCVCLQKKQLLCCVTSRLNGMNISLWL